MGAKRQRVAGRLLLVANLAVANLAAAVYVVLFVRPDALSNAAPAAAAEPGSARVALLPVGTMLAWLLMAGGVVLLIANFGWLVRRREQAPPSNWVLSATPSGPVRISREALEAGLQKTGEALPEITRLRIAVDTHTQKRVLVTAYFQCAEGAGNLAASQRLRQVLAERFGAMVHLADGARVEFELEFQGFAGKLGRKNVDLTPPVAEQEPPFMGPRYPIDDDGGAS